MLLLKKFSISKFTISANAAGISIKSQQVTSD